MTGLELPLASDVDRLREDLARVGADEWAAHYNERDYGGVWRGIALRSASGAANDLRAAGASFSETSLFDRCPYFREVLAAFRCPLKSARLLALAPGSYIREHTDDGLGFEDGEARIHVPIETNPGVEFFVRGERLILAPGRAYYVNVHLPHRVNNRGEFDRIHLVIDVEVNDWVRELFARGSEIERGAADCGVEAFRDRALADEGLRQRLRAIADRREFAGTAAALARELGFDFHEGDIDALLDGEPRAGAPGGLPYRLEAREGGPVLLWTDVPEGELAEPFYDDSTRRALCRPWGRFTRRAAPLTPRPSRLRGFVFHMSRCGSTLVAQMLKTAGYRVASEPAPVDEALAGDAGWLPAAAAALAVDFVKFDAWHIHQMPAIRAAFPDTPWVFLHRTVDEVLASHRKSPGKQALPGAIEPSRLGMTLADMTALDRETWSERVIGKMRESAERHRDDPMGLFVDYRELPDAVWRRVARHFGLELTTEQIERMRAVARFDAKSPGKLFTPAQGAR